MPGVNQDGPRSERGQSTDETLSDSSSPSQAVLQRVEFMINELKEHPAVPALRELQELAKRAFRQREAGDSSSDTLSSASACIRKLIPFLDERAVENAALGIFLVLRDTDLDLGELLASQSGLRVLKSGVADPQEFPTNAAGLRNGSIIVARIDLKPYGMRVDKGEGCELAFDGTYVRCGPYTWSVSQLEVEIEQGVWEVIQPEENGGTS